MVPSPTVLLVGLTGGMGSGKSTVSAALARRGAVVIDADVIVRELQVPGARVFDEMVARFGPGIVAQDGNLDRGRVAELVFGDDEALSDLNRIVHPAVGAEIARRLEALSGTDRVVVLDVPLLVESGRTDLAGLVVVDTDPEVALERLVSQRGFTEDDARARMARQASREERLGRADFVVRNDGDLDALEAEVARCWEWISGLS